MASVVRAVPARLDWLEALVEGDDVFAARFGVAVEPDWAGFPEAVPFAVDAARERPEDRWGTHLFFDVDGALVGMGGFKGAPRDGEVEVGYAVAPARQRRGIASTVVLQFVEQARAAGVTVVSAHTLAEPNASTAVLTKCGFERVDELADEHLERIWRWELRLDGR